MKYLPVQQTQIKKSSRQSHVVATALLGATLLLGTVAVIPHLASAQESVRSMTISPPTVSAQLDPGGKTEGVMKLINDTDVPLTFQATVHDFVVNDTVGTPTILPDNTLSNKFSGAAWVGIVPDTFTVQPHQREDMNYYIQVPADARPGGHYAAVVFKPTKAVGVTGTGASVETQIGSLLYIRVNGPITEKATVTKLAIRPFSEYGPLTANTLIKNMGDLDIKPEGYITVSNIFGQKSYVAQLPEHNIFPEASRQYTNSFGKKWMIGRYKAVLTATYGVNNNLPLSMTVYFWVFPWKIAVIIVLILIVLILGGVYLNRKRKGGTKDHTENPEHTDENTENKNSEDNKTSEDSTPQVETSK